MNACRDQDCDTEVVKADAEDPINAPLAAAAAPVLAEFIEPKPQQTGYVPVAPPSFAMPSAPTNAFDFTVRISPENKAD